jgi:hypothetical protein
MYESERADLFYEFAKSRNLESTVDLFYNVICRFDVPDHADRDFVYKCLIEYYSREEDYEKCAELLKYSKIQDRKKEITSEDLTISDLNALYTLQFTIPDNVVREVHENYFKQNYK